MLTTIDIRKTEENQGNLINREIKKKRIGRKRLGEEDSKFRSRTNHKISAFLTEEKNIP